MKRELNQIVIFIGFLAYAVGLIVGALIGDFRFAMLSTSALTVVLGCFFVFAKNEVLKYIGYGLCVISGTEGLANVIKGYTGTGGIICYIGQVILLVGVVIVFIRLVLKLFGYEKHKGENNNIDVIQYLNSLNTLKNDEVITEEEYAQLKAQTLEKANNNKNLTVNDLKQWKKLLDQNIITDEEFSTLKKDMFAKN